MSRHLDLRSFVRVPLPSKSDRRCAGCRHMLPYTHISAFATEYPGGDNIVYACEGCLMEART